MTDQSDKTGLRPHQKEHLLRKARSSAERAYAPYSNFSVGAAVLGKSGSIYRGANIENASYGLSVCAERVALSAAVMAGEEQIIAIAVACIDAPPDSPLEERVPCGACRQWMQELAPDAEILVTGEQRSFRLKDFLPHPFRLT